MEYFAIVVGILIVLMICLSLLTAMIFLIGGLLGAGLACALAYLMELGTVWQGIASFVGFWVGLSLQMKLIVRDTKDKEDDKNA